MTMTRFSLVAALILAFAGGARAQQPPPPAPSPQPAAGQAASRGACLSTTANGKEHCAAGLDAGACAALGAESRTKTTFKPDAACP